MSRIIQRNPARSLPVAAGGAGCWIVDRDGRRYLDASGGAAVSCLGHNHPDLVEALCRQAGTLSYAHTAFFTSEPAEALAERLVAGAPEGIGHVYFVSGGSEAVEAMLKLARQHWVERGEPQRRRFIARRQSYHGNTLGALSMSGNFRRALYEPLLFETSQVSPCYAYRYRAPGESDDEYAARLAAELEAEILRLGPETVIGFVAETVGGATAGCVTAVPGYFRRIREVCDRYGVLLLLDEVMCGMGRTGTLHACEQEGVAPDLMALAKGLGAGYQPIGAVLAARRVYEPILAGSGAFVHGHTYAAHATACAAALAVQQVLERDRLVERSRVQGERLARVLHERLGAHPRVGDIRGRGLFRALEFVADRASAEPFEPALRFHARVQAEAMQRGLCVYAMPGTIDGRRGDHVLLAPPYIVADDELELIAERLRAAIDAALAS